VLVVDDPAVAVEEPGAGRPRREVVVDARPLDLGSVPLGGRVIDWRPCKNLNRTLRAAASGCRRDGVSGGLRAVSELIQVTGCDDATRRADVVYVHGLGGNPRAYWCHEGKDENFWPRWLGQDLSHVGVWSYGYDAAWSGWLGNTMELPQRAQDCLERLTLDWIGARPLVFIAHSLGGLVVKYALFRSLKRLLKNHVFFVN